MDQQTRLLIFAWVIISLTLGLVNFVEAFITSLSVARLKSVKAMSAKPFWEAARRWLSHPEEYLTILLLLQNILEAFYAWSLMLIVGAFVQDMAMRQTLVWVFGGTGSLVFLTIYPKALARRLSFGRSGANVLRFMRIVLSPFYPLLRVVFVIVGYLTGGRPKEGLAMSRGLALSFEELRELVD
ncbi:MAG: CNNM domain-containing protein [Elusimicrobiota bacterium]